MNTLNIYNISQHIQKLLSVNSSSFTALIDRTQHKLNIFHAKKKEPSLSILYPSRTATDMTFDTFFSTVQKTTYDHTIETLKRQSYTGSLCPHYIAPREPIVLCHGLFGFDVRGPEYFPILQRHYWDGIEDSLAKLGAKVIVTKVPHAGSISERSQALHRMLSYILTGKNVNFVAHSMGGLDCRHLLANYRSRPYNVQSLTTISTPHRGSPVMDWFKDHLGLGSDPTWSMSTNTKKQLARWEKWFLHYFDTPAYSQLTTDFCLNHFNPNTPDDTSVEYYSYGASVKMSNTSLLSFPGKLVYHKEGENDGIVSVKSAQWGNYIKTVEADHWDLSGKSCFP
ncbi:Alpha/Beta hydrolase protein [Sporodiniella umbellata]|nr:Alpha/Beta hydrolase protein [Sporodiniella umbellata]